MARRVNSLRFVGRSDEAGALEGAVAAARDERPAIVLLAGEAGVGKTRLVREVEARVRAQGALALRGECIELSGGEFPFAPVVGALRDAGWEVLAEAVESLAPEGRSELGRLVPEIGRWLDEPPREPTRPPPQGRLFELLLALLRRLGEEAPLLFVIEDAHWADASTRDFLGFLARNLSHERLAIVVTYRLDELGPDHPLRSLLGELIRCDPIETVTLERLGRDEIEEILQNILGEAAPLALVDEVFDRSDGNPFFAEELIAARASGDIERLPESLRDALLLRVEALPPDAVELLKRLAVLGRPAGDRVLGALAGMDEARRSPVLRAALTAHILSHRRRDDTFDFRHALVREAVAGELLPSERIALHQAVAETLMSTEDGTAAELAYHWDAAGRRDAALAASIEAGLEAEQGYASAEARLQFERAASLWEALEPEPGALALDRVDLLRHAAEAARLTGDWEAAAALCREALTLVDADAEPLRAALLHERLGEYLLWDDEAALECYSTALALLPVDSRRERARILGAKALALHFLLRWEESRVCAEEALLEARQAGGRSEEGYARTVLGVVLAFLGDPEEGEEHALAAKQIAEELGGAEDVARAYVHLAEVLRIRGKVAEALEVMLEGEKLAARMGMTSSFGRAMSLNATEDLIRIGRWEEAADRLGWTARLSLRAGAELYQHSLEGRLAVARGDGEEATRHLSAAREISDDHTPVEYIADVYAGFAELALWSGGIDDARREAADGLARVGDRAEPLYCPVLFWLGARAAADAAGAERARGHEAEEQEAREAVADLATGLEQVVARYSMKEPPAEASAYLELCRAEYTRAAGSPDGTAWATAAATWSRLGQPYHEAYSRWRAAEALMVGGGERGQATELLAAARDAATRLGARPLLDEIDALARAGRLDVAAPGEEPPAVPADHSELGLTARELEVLRLIAEGCTNRQIAERLFISQKTASVHVSHILGKLNAENRVQAAGIAHRLELLDTSSVPE
jgi:DNA-binding CsgD family transcriptional regulator